MKRLDEVIVCADGVTLNAIFKVASSRQKNKGNKLSRAGVSDLATKLKAVHLGHDYVRHNQVRRVLRKAL